MSALEYLELRKQTLEEKEVEMAFRKLERALASFWKRFPRQVRPGESK